MQCSVCIAYHVRVPVASSKAVEEVHCSMGPLLCGGWEGLLGAAGSGTADHYQHQPSLSLPWLL